MAAADEVKVKLVHGNLLNYREADIIVQQTNCLTTRSHGLAASIASKFPYANLYSKRRNAVNCKNLACKSDRSKPGSLVLCKPPSVSLNKFQPIVACIMGQFEMAKPGKYHRIGIESQIDTAANRQKWFAQGLQRLATYLEISRRSVAIDCETSEIQRKKAQAQATGGGQKKCTIVAFPDHIGCGLAGGDWLCYKQMIFAFAKAVAVHGASVVIVKMD